MEGVGLPLGSALEFQVAIGIINLIFTILALWRKDSWWGMSVEVSLAIIAALFYTEQLSGIWIVIVLCINMAALAFSINAVIWVLTGEKFPNHLRGIAMSIATFANCGANFLTAFLFPIDQIGIEAGFLIFAFMCLIATLFFYKFIPETKVKSLKAIEHHWKNKGD